MQVSKQTLDLFLSYFKINLVLTIANIKQDNRLRKKKKKKIREVVE